jgi:hypothetical protein
MENLKISVGISRWTLHVSALTPEVVPIARPLIKTDCCCLPLMQAR